MAIENIIPKIGTIAPTKEVSASQLIEMAESTEVLLEDIDYFVLYDHVILDTASKSSKVDSPLYTTQTPFAEPLILSAALSQRTKRIQFITGVLVAPQRQTVLLGQQTALLSNLSGNRFQLGVGVGWNESEFEAMGAGEDFHNRGKKLDQQLKLLRQLWTQEEVSFQIGDEKIDRMALNPRPNTKIPIWVGGQAAPVLDRAAQYGDGWIPLGNVETVIEKMALLHQNLEKYGRTIEDFKIMGRVTLGTKPLNECVFDFLRWQEVGVTHIALSTTGSGYDKSDNYWFHQGLIIDFLQAIQPYTQPGKTSIYSNYPLDLVTNGSLSLGYSVQHRSDQLLQTHAKRKRADQGKAHKTHKALLTFLDQKIIGKPFNSIDNLTQILGEWGEEYAKREHDLDLANHFKTLKLDPRGYIYCGVSMGGPFVVGLINPLGRLAEN